jgi:hypothetical protein
MGANSYIIQAIIPISTRKSQRFVIPENYIPVGLFTDPVGMTGTTLTFDASLVSTGGSEFVVGDGAGNAYSLTNISNLQFMKLDANLFAGIPYLEVLSNGTEAAARTITIVCQKNVVAVV